LMLAAVLHRPGAPDVFSIENIPVPQPRDGQVPHPDRQPGEPVPGDARLTGAFDPGNTGTWRVRDVVPGADGGRRTTVILRYLLGVLAIDHVRSLSRWAFALPVVGLVLLVVRPRWIGLAVIVLGVLLIVGRIVAVRMISRHTLPRRYRPVEDELRAAVEAGKANLRGELRRVGMPTSGLALTRSVDPAIVPFLPLPGMIQMAPGTAPAASPSSTSPGNPVTNPERGPLVILPGQR